MSCQAPLAAGPRPRHELTRLGSLEGDGFAFPSAGGDVSKAEPLLKYVDWVILLFRTSEAFSFQQGTCPELGGGGGGGGSTRLS